MIALFGHPARAFQMAVMHSAGAIGINVGIQAKDDRRNVAPFRARFSSIKEPQIGDKMALVVSRNTITDWRAVIEWRVRHGPSLCFDTVCMLRPITDFASVFAKLGLSPTWEDRLLLPVWPSGTPIEPAAYVALEWRVY